MKKQPQAIAIDETTQQAEMQDEIDNDFRDMDAATFARHYLPPPGFVNYSDIRDDDCRRYNTIREVRADIESMTDIEFDTHYHENKISMRRRLEAWLLLGEPTWNVEMLMKAFRLSLHSHTAELEIESLLMDSQAVGSLGATFPQSQGIHWLRKKGITPFSEFIGQHPPIYQKDASMETGQVAKDKHAKTQRISLMDEVSPYIVSVMRREQYTTAKELFKKLEAACDDADSPFSKGTGVHLQSLFIRESSRSLSLKTLQNNWVALRVAAKKK